LFPSWSDYGLISIPVQIEWEGVDWMHLVHGRENW
jgi:hypothetical protein